MDLTGDEWVPAKVDSGGSTAKVFYNRTAYFDLRSYAMKATDFPRDDATFSQLLPQESFKKIEENDTIYINTRDLMVDIGKISFDLITNKIEKMVTIASGAISYATTAIESMEDKDKVNLRRYLGVILDEKYTEPGPHDDAYNVSHQAAKDALSHLKLQADKNRAETDELAQFLRNFRDAPATTNSKVPYLTYLFGDVQKKLKDTVTKASERKNKESEWEKYTTAAQTGWIAGGGGVIATASAAAKAASFRREITDLDKEIADIRKDTAAEEVLITKINHLLSLWDGVSSQMRAATVAATDLASLFDNQSQLYGYIGNDLELLGRGLDCKVADIRKDFITTATKSYLVDMRELLSSAKEFSATASQPEAKV